LIESKILELNPDYSCLKKNDDTNYEKIKVENRKGRYASTTERRRVVWEDVMWPLIMDLDKSYFTLEEYRIKRNEVCKSKNFIPKQISGGFISLLHKGIIKHEEKLYSIHYKLIPYIRNKVDLDYGTALRETHS
jgi:hypothetical protein